MSRAPAILVTRRPPFPLDNGARIRTQRLAVGLGERFDLTLVTFADGPRHDDAEWSEEDLARVLPGLRVQLVPYGGPHPRGPRRGVLGRTSSFGAYARPTLRRALADLVDRSPGAVLHLDDPGVALAGMDLPAAVTAFSPHNVEHRIIREIAAQFGPTHRPFWELEWRKLAREERWLWRASDLCLAVSEVDAETMKAGGARRVEVFPNGTDPVSAPPLPPLHPGTPLRLLFVGSADYWPYELGLAWFVNEVMPLLRADGPVAFDVVGAPPARPVAAEGVAYQGRVPDVSPYYGEAHALVIPVFQGSGTRLKAVEAAARQRPIISTGLGIEGLPLREGEHYVRAESAEDFAAAVRRLRAELVEDPAGVERKATGARAAVTDFFWPRIASDLADLYERELAAQRRPSAGARRRGPP